MTTRKDIEGEGFEIVDHEESQPESADDREGSAAPDAEAAEEEVAAEEDAGETVGEPSGEVPSLDVYAVLRVSIAQLSGAAWQMMGLQADPLTGQVHADFGQARIAIDAAAALVDQLLPHVQGQEARDYRSLLTDLRLNFVKQSGEAKPE